MCGNGFFSSSLVRTVLNFNKTAIISCLDTQSSMPIQYNYWRNQKLKRIAFSLRESIPSHPMQCDPIRMGFISATWLFVWHGIRKIIYASHFQMGWYVISFRSLLFLQSVCLPRLYSYVLLRCFFSSSQNRCKYNISIFRECENMSEFICNWFVSFSGD